jgi:hypothetical protein
MGMPVIPENICGPCGQPGGAHLPMCPTLGPPPVAPAPAPAETPEQQEHQHNLGQAI